MKSTMLTKMLVLGLVLIVCRAGLSQAASIGTGFTYQGRLIDANSAADGLYDFQFKLYDANVGGNKVSYDVNTPDLDVIDGYFTASLDFGSVFDGNDRWLQIGVRTGELKDPNAYTILSPRQQVTLAPYAFYAKKAGTVSGGITGSGTANRIAKFTGSNTIGNAPIYENSQGRIGIRGAAFWGSKIPWQPAYGPDLHVNAGASFADVWLGDANSTNGAELGRLAFVGYGGVIAPPETIYAAITGRIVDHANSKGALSFYTSSTEQMRISSSGKVGIGTTDPQTDLHVHGSVGAIRMTNPTTGITNGLQLGFITDNSIDAAVWNTVGGGYLMFGTASYERMRITSDGKVGIGTENPTGILHVDGGMSYGDGTNITLKAEDGYDAGGGPTGDGGDGGDIILMPGLGGDGGWWSGADGTPGGVGIGTTGPTEKLIVNGSINSNNQSNNFSSGGTRVFMDLIGASKIARIGTLAGGDSLSGTQGELGLYVKGSEYVRINAAGNVGIGCTDPSEKLDAAGTARLRGIAPGSGTPVVADGNGKLWKQSSSQEYKTNIQALDADTDAVLKLRPVRFQWKTTGQNDIGLIAEEVEQQLNDLVIYDNEGRPDAVKYDRVSLYLLDVVKDLKAENESLKKADEDIKNRLAAMESSVAKLSLQLEGGIK